MKQGLLFVFVLILLSPTRTNAQTCGDALFLLQNDLISYGGNPHPCIKSYNGTAAQLTWPNYYCTGWAFQMMPGTGYIVLGPTVSVSAISVDYDSWTTATVRVYTSSNSTGPWNEVQYFVPSTTSCDTKLTPTIGIGMYYMIQQDPIGGGSTGPLSIRNIFPENPVPVQLTSFAASKLENRVKLTWKTATEINNFGFDVERQVGSGKWMTIGFIAGHGTVNTPKSYSYVDIPPAVSDGHISYRLRQIDRDGHSEYSPVVTVSVNVPKAFGLSEAYPNPFNPSTTLSYSVPEPTRVTLTILDRSGREIARLVDNEHMNTGTYSQVFLARNVPSGDYFAWLYSAHASSVQKLVLVK